jgi:hypothetical protein
MTDTIIKHERVDAYKSLIGWWSSRNIIIDSAIFVRHSPEFFDDLAPIVEEVVISKQPCTLVINITHVEGGMVLLTIPKQSPTNTLLQP